MMALLDVNEDGAQDLIFGLAQMSGHVTIITQSQYCQQYKDGCLGEVFFL